MLNFSQRLWTWFENEYGFGVKCSKKYQEKVKYNKIDVDEDA